MSKKAPLMPVALAMMTGIAIQHWLPCVATWYWWALAIGGVVAAACAVALPRTHIHGIVLLSALVGVAGIGGSLGRHSDPRYTPSEWTRIAADATASSDTAPPDQVEVYLTAQLTDTPQPHKRSWRAKAKVTGLDGATATGDITIYLRKDTLASTLRYGDILTIHGYANLQQRSIYTTSDHYIVSGRDSLSLRARSERLRMHLLHRMHDGPLDIKNLGVAEALTLGWKADISPEAQSSFRDAGIAHLLAVSGLHVGLLTAIAGWLMCWVPKVRRGRIAKGCILLATVWGFALLTGMAPATIRAALMFSLFIISDIGERRTPGMNLLATTAILTLTAKPMLLMDAGWQLSYAAVAGILLGQPLISMHRNFIWQAATVSLVATLSTLAITTGVFHRIQPYFLIANIIIIPMAGVILALALAYMAAPCTITAWPLNLLLQATQWVTGKVASLPGATVELEPTAWWVTALLAVAATTIMVGINITMQPKRP